MHTQVNDIDDEHFGLPNVNIGLKNSDSSRELLRKASSSAVNGRKLCPKLFLDPHTSLIPLPRAGDMYLIGCSSAQLLDQAAINKDMVSFQISVKESSSFTDLLSKILTYKPQDRFSLRDITEHPWLTASFESTQKTPIISSSATDQSLLTGRIEGGSLA